MRPLAILRPEPGASLSVARAKEMGFDEIVRLPLFKVRPVDWTPPDPERFDAILLTSANAARHAGDGLAQLKQLPCHVVGEATATAAHAAGLMVDRVGDGGVDALLDLLPGGQRLLHLTGTTRRQPRNEAHTIVPVAVYASIERAPIEGIERLAGSVACVHSPRAGQRLAALVDDQGLSRGSIAIAAISETSAEACGSGWLRLGAAASPDDPTLLALAKRMCEQSFEGSER